MNRITLLILISILFSINMQLEGQNNLTTGPESGTLMIVGGGAGDEIYRKWIDLVGGPETPIVVIPTAAGRDQYNQDASGAGKMRQLGAKDVTVLHANHREEANSQKFLNQLRRAKAVWFGGGRQWRLVDAYGGTKAERAFWSILKKGGVIGGSSAGATIQGSYLARGDTQNNQIMMGDHEAGFAFIKNIAIDQHAIARNRHFDMFNILEQRPELLGIAIDEDTAIIVQGNRFEVVGDSYVIVYDGTFWSREGSSLKQLPEAEQLFYFLREGDRYDMRSRRILKN